MSLVGAVTELMFGATLILVVDHVWEPIWDRALILGICAGIWIYTGFKGVPDKRVYQIVTVLFYLFTIHTLWTCFNNEFQWVYVLTLILNLQAVTISFRDETQATPFLLAVIVLVIAAVIFSDMGSVQDRVLVASAMGVSCFLLFIVVRIRSRFYRNLKVQEEVMRSIVTTTQNALIITDSSAVILDANSRCEVIFGLKPSELIGKNFAELRANPLREKQVNDLLRILAVDRIYSSERELIRKDGTVFSAYITIAFIEQGEEEFMVYSIKGVTEEKRTQQNLIRAKDNAERAAAMKSQFLATVSHEVRTPLNGIMGMTELMLQTELDGTQQSHMDQIRTSNNHLLFIVNDILDFSKIEGGKMELEALPFNLKDVVLHAMKTFSGPAELKGLKLLSSFEKVSHMELEGDANRIKQILLNLIGNAIKFTEEGSITLEVETRRGRTGMDQVIIAVKDTGIGIPKDKIKGLFEAFSQVDSSHSRKFGGTGLGLAICHKLAGMMKGTIRVESEAGEGSNFILEMKLKRSKGVAEIPKPLTPEDLVQELDIPDNLRVLLAEDNQINQHVGKLILGQMGITAEIAENGVEVIDMLRKNTYDIIFMDLQMPEMDGLEATKLILDPAGEFDNKPVIIAMTANAMPQDIALCESIGMVGFVSKPIMMDELRSALIKSIDILKRRA